MRRHPLVFGRSLGVVDHERLNRSILRFHLQAEAIEMLKRVGRAGSAIAISSALGSVPGGGPGPGISGTHPSVSMSKRPFQAGVVNERAVRKVFDDLNDVRHVDDPSVDSVPLAA
jgi:hypothetical protein